MIKKVIKTFVFILAVHIPVALLASTSYSDSGKQQVANTKWQAGIPGSIRLNMLSLPGTHDTMTYTSKASFVQTQTLNLREQLNSGIRVVDIRVQLSHGSFAIHHGDIYLHKNFTDVLKDVTSFLNKNPSEFVVMRISKTGGKGADYEKALSNYISEYSKYFWWNKSSTAKNPTVGEIRKKIVVLRHDSWIPDRLGIEYPSKSNTQDWYDVTDVKEKYNKVIALVNKTNKDKNPPIAINYLSGTIVEPHIIASINNGKVRSYLNGNHKHQIGMIMMDFPGGELINTIISYNRFYDMGYHQNRFMADVNGDGRADYCRMVGDGQNKFYSCSLSSGSHFKYEYSISAAGFDGTQQFVDIDGNGFDDFCREVGNRPNNSWVQCTLLEKGSVNNEGIVIPKTKDIIKFHRKLQTSGQWLRQFIDVNGDGRADMCRGVSGGFNCYFYTGIKGLPFGGKGHQAFFKVNHYGSSKFRQLAVLYDGSTPYFCRKSDGNPSKILCSRLKITNGEGSFDRDFYLASDAGYDGSMQIADVDGDGEHEYCREVGNRDKNDNQNRIECVRGNKIVLSVQRNSLGYTYFRQFADVTGNKRMEYVRAAGDEPNTFLTVTKYKKDSNDNLVPERAINHRPGFD